VAAAAGRAHGQVHDVPDVDEHVGDQIARQAAVDHVAQAERFGLGQHRGEDVLMPGQREGVLLDGDDRRQVGDRKPADDGQPVSARVTGQ
jgi:hypothetical protein